MLDISSAPGGGQPVGTIARQVRSRHEAHTRGAQRFAAAPVAVPS